MYIEPNSTFWILKDVPLDPTYEHTLYFPNLTAQVNYFKGKQKYRLERQSYQRVKRGYMRVEIRAENLYDCNYIMFQNTGYGAPGILDAKWWFAFITSVEYINNEVSEISFMIDDMQTWYFNYTLGRNFVAREHSATDSVGDNLVPEDVNLGTYVRGYAKNSPQFEVDLSDPNSWKIVLVAASDIPIPTLPTIATPQYQGGRAEVSSHKSYPCTQQGLHDLYDDLFNGNLFRNLSSVMNIYMCPAAFVPTDGKTWRDSFTIPVVNQQDDLWDSPNGINDIVPTLGRYTPKNNKLYTYPYTYFTVSNNQGTVKEFRYEYFPKVYDSVHRKYYNAISFEFYCDNAVDPTVLCVPCDYCLQTPSGGTGQYIEPDISNAIPVTNFPQCTWASDDIIPKLVQGGIGMALGALSAGAKYTSFAQGEIQPQYTPLSVNTPNMPRLTDGEHLSTSVMHTSPMFKTTKDEVHSVEFKLNPADAATAAYLSRTIYNSSYNTSIARGSAWLAAKYFGINYQQVYLDKPFAKIVDDYFTRFGYAVNEIKVPNTHVRENFTYVKTVACSISGSVPADAANNICKIYNNGITFWSNPNNVGDYSVSNRCLVDIE